MKTIFALIIATILGTLLLRKILAQKQTRTRARQYLFAQVRELLTEPQLRKDSSFGTQRMDGYYGDHPVQIQTITDTLATRKLPSLWLMVTLPAKLPVTAKLDMMLRPAGPTSFSNFDFLNHNIRQPNGFPKDAVLRSDAETGYADLHVVANHLAFFNDPSAKELLITPSGLRLVIQLAEADRSRYVIMREANFSSVQIEADSAKIMIETLLALKAALEDHARS